MNNKPAVTTWDRDPGSLLEDLKQFRDMVQKQTAKSDYPKCFGNYDKTATLCTGARCGYMAADCLKWTEKNK